MGPKVLFSGTDIYEFVETQKTKLKNAYESLPDDAALDEATTQDLKTKFALRIPTLKDEGDWTREERPITPNPRQRLEGSFIPYSSEQPGATEHVFYIPFDGDPEAFEIAPSAYNGNVAVGEVVGHELLIPVRPPSANFDIMAQVKREVGQVEWNLNNLRGSMAHFEQQLEHQIRECIAGRKRALADRAKLIQNLTIPRRQPQLAAVPVLAPSARPSPSATTLKEKWDIFMSHAWPDKPYVEPLVGELKKAGVSVWYDNDVLDWGDGMRRGINKGLIASRYAIVVLSKAFLAERKWTEHELNGLFAREQTGNVIILPIWHGIEREDLLNYDPELADRLAKMSATDTYPDIVQSVLKKLGRGQDPTPVDQTASVRPARNQDGEDRRKLVAYAWYETTGPDAKKEKVFVRESDYVNGAFVFINDGHEHEGTMEVIATKFFMSDRYLKSKGYLRMNHSNPSMLPSFNLSN